MDLYKECKELLNEEPSDKVMLFIKRLISYLEKSNNTKYGNIADMQKDLRKLSVNV